MLAPSVAEEEEEDVVGGGEFVAMALPGTPPLPIIMYHINSARPIYVSDMVGPLTTVSQFQSSLLLQVCVPSPLLLFPNSTVSLFVCCV